MADPFAKLASFKDLKPGWNSYGAPQITEESIKSARDFLLIQPQPVPTSQGGVQLEWHLKGLDLELNFDKHGKITGVAAILTKEGFDG
jgi:hypothetical protein